MLFAALVAYSVFLAIYILYSIYAFHHLNEYGYSGSVSQQMVRVYLVISGAILLLTGVAVFIGLVSQ